MYPIRLKSRILTCLLGVCAAALCLGVHPWAGEAKAASMLKVGLLQEPKTLNIWLASDRWSLKVLGQIYQTLYIRDPETLNFVPWLAQEDPVFHEATLSYTVKIRPAKWSDGAEVTSEDVAFTGRIIKEFKVPRYASKWNFVKKIETPDKHTVRFYLEEPKAIFESRTLTTPIVQKKQWLPVVEAARKTEKPLTSLLNHKVENPVGCGPFLFKDWKQGAYLFLQKNASFFGNDRTINNRKLGPFIRGIIFKIYGTSDAAVLALKKGDIDMFWWAIQPGYLDELKKDEEIRIVTSEKSGLYYMGFNARRPPFSDPLLRRAVATSIDKDFILTRILQGLGTKMHSIIPPGNRAYYCPELPRYGEGLSKEARAKAAYELLRQAGYTWEVPPVDDSGKVVKGQGMRLPNGKPMADFTILTPPADYDPHRAMAGMMVQEWLRALGMPAFAKPMAFGSLIDQVKTRHEFDAFILGYGNLSLDPDYLRAFFHSKYDKPKGWNMSGYNNPEYDRIADQSARTMNKDERRALIRQMQEIIIRDVPYIPLYNPSLVEAVRTDRFRGWVQMLGGIGNTWSFCQLKPK
jgi:ABC-type transport system substrate-binding protein